MDIPEDIYESALEFQSTGKATHSDNQRLASMGGYVKGATEERRRYDEALAHIDQRLAKIDRALALIIETLNH